MCSMCSDGKAPNIDGKCPKICAVEKYCASCDDIGNCKTCLNSAVQPISGACSAPMCPPGTYRDGSNCNPCSQTLNCNTCANSTTCTTCLDPSVQPVEGRCEKPACSMGAYLNG